MPKVYFVGGTKKFLHPAWQALLQCAIRVMVSHLYFRLQLNHASCSLVFHWVRLSHSSRTVEMHNLHAEVCFLRPTIALPTLKVVTKKLDCEQSLSFARKSVGESIWAAKSREFWRTRATSLLIYSRLQMFKQKRDCSRSAKKYASS